MGDYLDYFYDNKMKDLLHSKVSKKRRLTAVSCPSGAVSHTKQSGLNRMATFKPRLERFI